MNNVVPLYHNLHILFDFLAVNLYNLSCFPVVVHVSYFLCLNFFDIVFMLSHNCRYIYIPLGGSQRKLLNVWVIFTFVAIWHDLEWYITISYLLICHSDRCQFKSLYFCSSSNSLFPLLQEASLMGMVNMYFFYSRDDSEISCKCAKGGAIIKFLFYILTINVDFF